jgi:hypothetical protein
LLVFDFYDYRLALVAVGATVLSCYPRYSTFSGSARSARKKKLKSRGQCLGAEAGKPRLLWAVI